MTYKYKEFDLFTAEQIKNMLLYDSKKFFELFADLYVVAYRIEHKHNQFYDLSEQRNDELKQALNLCKQCLNLIEKTIQNRD